MLKTYLGAEVLLKLFEMAKKNKIKGPKDSIRRFDEIYTVKIRAKMNGSIVTEEYKADAIFSFEKFSKKKGFKLASELIK